MLRLVRVRIALLRQLHVLALWAVSVPVLVLSTRLLAMLTVLLQRVVSAMLRLLCMLGCCLPGVLRSMLDWMLWHVRNILVLLLRSG